MCDNEEFSVRDPATSVISCYNADGSIDYLTAPRPTYGEFPHITSTKEDPKIKAPLDA